MYIMIIVVMYYTVICYVAILKGVKIHIKEVGVIWKLYPQRYIMPSRGMRKQFKLEKKDILKFYYYQLYVANGCLLVLCSYVLIFVLSNFNIDLMYFLLFIFSVIMILDFIIMEAKTFLYKKMKRNNSKI